jgi:hypothetical protein
MLTQTETQVRDFLISIAKLKKFITYGELADQFNLVREDKHQAWIGILEEWMGDINKFEIDNGRPMISAIIILSKDKRDINKLHNCGNGFYSYARELGLLKKGEDPQIFWAKETAKIFDYWSKN